jgi:hypothetical protein
MAPYSRKLAGVVLPWMKDKSHLSKDRKTVADEETAKINFKHAGCELGHYWAGDSYGLPLFYQYTDKEVHEETVPFEWIEKHCQMGQYSLDIRKCNDRSCCSPRLLPEFERLLSKFNGFLPGLCMRKNGSYADVIPLMEFPPNRKLRKKFQLDACLPSKSDTYRTFICQECGKYYPTKGLLGLHKKQHRQSLPIVSNTYEDLSALRIRIRAPRIAVSDSEM